MYQRRTAEEVRIIETTIDYEERFVNEVQTQLQF